MILEYYIIYYIIFNSSIPNHSWNQPSSQPRWPESKTIVKLSLFASRLEIPCWSDPINWSWAKDLIRKWTEAPFDAANLPSWIAAKNLKNFQCSTSICQMFKNSHWQILDAVLYWPVPQTCVGVTLSHPAGHSTSKESPNWAYESALSRQFTFSPALSVIFVLLSITKYP